jgi:hypothetical protein
VVASLASISRVTRGRGRWMHADDDEKDPFEEVLLHY